MLIRNCLCKNFLLSVLCVCALSFPVWATNGMFPTFMGIPGAGRAGVDIGISSDPTCINTNPGGLGFLHGKMIEMSLGSYFPSISFESNYDRAKSEFEPVPIGSLAFTWDHLNQTGQIFSDPFVYAFGGTPQNSEYIYISGEKPLSSDNAQNYGTGFLDLTIPDDLQSLQLHAIGTGVLQGLRVFVQQQPVESSQTVFLTHVLPKLPPQAEVTSVAVHYDWAMKNSVETAFIFLVCDEKIEKISLLPSESWKEGYLALAWDKTYFPHCIQIRSHATNGNYPQIKIKEILLGYRLVGKTYWENIPLTQTFQQSKEWSQVSAFDTRQYALTGHIPIKIALSPLLKHIPSQSKIRLVYSYDRKVEIPSRLEIIVQADSQILARNLHGSIPRESLKPVPICQRSADHEIRMNERASGWKLGLGIFPQAGAKYTMEVKTDDLFQDGIENRTDMTFISIAPAIAYRFGDRLSIGVSLNLNWEMIELDGLVSQTSTLLQGKLIDGTNTTFGEFLIGTRDIYHIKGELDTNALWGFGVGGRIGLMWKITDRIQLGAMYSPKTMMMDAEGKVTLDFNRHFQSIDVANLGVIFLPNKGQEGFSGKYDMKLDFELPQQAGVGLSWLVADNVMVAADFRWIDYSDTQYVIQAKLTNGSNVDLNALVGGKGATARIQVGWKDQYVAGIGIVWQSSPHWVWRMGYSYNNNPVPEEYLNPQLAAISEHHVTLGSSYVVNRNLTVHAAIEAALPNKLKSGGINYVHEKYANSELEMFTIAALMGISMRF